MFPTRGFVQDIDGESYGRPIFIQVSDGDNAPDPNLQGYGYGPQGCGCGPGK